MSQQELSLISIPAQPGPQEQDLVALKDAARKIAALLASSGVKEEEIIVNFQEARQREMLARKTEKL